LKTDLETAENELDNVFEILKAKMDLDFIGETTAKVPPHNCKPLYQAGLTRKSKTKN
jgi:hypothetical protein